uniref:Rho-GAP domain-containing protein n=1 Tax=Syphacia muris TaxID=451379 RepID=A0A0N5AYV4_9BILA
MVLCGNVDGYRGKIEKMEIFMFTIINFSCVKVLLLKVNKEGPSKKDIWRAPGNHAQIRTLARHMRDGTLVNISHFDEKTVASVIKLFLSKIPGGIFGFENEKRLFENFPRANAEDQRQLFCRVVCSLCLPSQHLLVLLFGTFHMVSEASDIGSAKMTPDALGISVAPSLFHSCIHMREAKMEDVLRSKIASEVISKVIQNFGHISLFPKTCYEFYARMTGRTMRVDENAVKLLFTLPNNPMNRRNHEVLSLNFILTAKFSVFSLHGVHIYWFFSVALQLECI